MNNKIKIQTEKKVEPRLAIPYEGQMLVVNDPSEMFRNEMIKGLIETIADGKDFDDKKIIFKLIDHCTNVEFDKNVLEAEHLTHEAKLITNEILIIFQEIIGETYQLMQIALEQARNDKLQKEILDEKNKLIEEVKKIEKIKENVEEVKEEKVLEDKEMKVTRKPQRRRKK